MQVHPIKTQPQISPLPHGQTLHRRRHLRRTMISRETPLSMGGMQLLRLHPLNLSRLAAVLAQTPCLLLLNHHLPLKRLEVHLLVKSRIQGTTKVPGVLPKYNWTYPSLVIIAREEGIRALYKGFVPKVLRLAPGGGVLLLVVEATLTAFRKNTWHSLYVLLHLLTGIVVSIGSSICRVVI